MLIYFIILAVPLFVGLGRKQGTSLNHGAFTLYFLLLLCFIGFRFEVGPDWMGYIHIYDLYFDEDWAQILNNREPGFFLLNKLSQDIGFGFQGVIFLSAFVFLFGLFAYARTSLNPWLSLAVVMPYLVFVIAMSGIRQACAIGIGFYLLAHWQRLGLARMLLLVALAVSFHNSAIIYLVFVVVSLNMRPVAKLIFLTLIAAFLSYTMTQTDVVDRYKSVYIVDNLVSTGALFHVLLTSIPAALFFFYRKGIERVTISDPNVLYGSIGALLALPLLQFSSTGVDRLTLYLSFVQMWVYPALLHARVIPRMYLNLILLIIVLTVFFVYFSLGSHASAYLPYENVWF